MTPVPIPSGYHAVHTDGVARRLVLDRASNVRDLGGFDTPGGKTRFGRVLRADQLGTLSDADVAALTGHIRVERIVDLRGIDEAGAAGSGRLADLVDYRLIPVRDQANDTYTFEAQKGLSYAERYLSQLEHHADRFVRAVRHLVEGDGPAIVHCTAGKDRTGLVAMLLLSTAGVDDEAVVDDYAATARVPPEAKQASRDPILDEFWAEYMRFADTADVQTPETMTATMHEVLAGVADRWGSPAGYLAIHGDDELVTRVRTVLVG
ncbi:MAG: tyrosine-protein phosphatase [Acidimicrobiales bacterium]